jgi:polyisoprenoid-binding protein YceI
MKTLIGFFAFFLIVSSFAFTPNPGTTVAKVDLRKSRIVWKASKVTGSHDGLVNLKAGSLEFNSKNELTGGMFEVDMTSIICTDLTGDMNGKLVGHLKSDDFFGVEKFPTSKLVITKVTKQKGNTYDVTADLTIKGKTHPVNFTTEISQTTGKASIKVDRTLYDVRYGSGKFFDNLGDKTIYDNFDLNVELVYTK